MGRFLIAEPSAVWLTTAGLALAGLGYRAAPPSVTSVAHRHAVGWVRAEIEGCDPSITRTSERELREELATGRRTHVLDAKGDPATANRFAGCAGRMESRKNVPGRVI